MKLSRSQEHCRPLSDALSPPVGALGRAKLGAPLALLLRLPPALPIGLSESIDVVFDLFALSLPSELTCAMLLWAHYTLFLPLPLFSRATQSSHI